MQAEIAPGLLVLHGNRLELLRDAVLDWLARRPLEPLETEVLLVQSNGAAEWLKMALAQHSGICAATRVELPARFLWRCYRQVLGADTLPARSPLDKAALAWRLMRLLPQLSTQRSTRAVFEPIAGFLTQGPVEAGAERRLQLALRLADLLDQYQVHRSDWLAAWAEGRDELPLLQRAGTPIPVPLEQCWQAVLWRALRAELDERALRAVRPQVHQDFLAALKSAAVPPGALPRRVVLFGAAHLPNATLQALAALSAHSQVLLAVPNPCRYHWADIIEGREVFGPPLRQRLPDRLTTGGVKRPPLAQLPLAAMHAHAHPLLAAWGRQGRDFMRQLDRFEDATGLPRVDLYDEGPGGTLLEQVQAAIRDLLPLSEHPRRSVAVADRSIDFHIAHGPMREVEILHDRLLDLLDHPPGPASGLALNPRDIVVMVPDIERFAPAIRAVFGQVPRSDPRFIPYEIADLRQRDSNPLLLALEWLLRIGSQRVLATQVFDLLDVPGIARRFALRPDDLPHLRAWAADAGVRWGLHEAQRATLGLGTCGEMNSWAFGLRRMLLGYASGAGPAFDGIEPHAEIGGLQAASLGGLADLVAQIGAWWELAAAAASPAQWAQHARGLLGALVDPADERERLTLAALQTALADWLEACDEAGFDESVPMAVLREGWLGGVDGGAASGQSSGRFLAGGVTFCTLLPLRAVPFDVVCLLGMNDADYPRPAVRNDFDLMALPGQQRPGDRSRRDDDRYLMLEALLSARRVLHVSWAGRSVRDNTRQPPSVLVAQLRDYLAAGWQPASGGDLLRQLSTEHPLQPFSRRYFETGGETVGGESEGAGRPTHVAAAPNRLATWAREWREVHAGAQPPDAGVPGLDRAPGLAGSAAAGALLDPAPAPPFAASPAVATIAESVLSPVQLARFLRNPVKAYCREQLGVVFEDSDIETTDEAFTLGGLPRHAVLQDLVADPDAAELAERLLRVQREGRLPLGTPGRVAMQDLEQSAAPMLAAWHQLARQWPLQVASGPRVFEIEQLRLQHMPTDLRRHDNDNDKASMWLALTPSKLADEAAKPRPLPHRLLDAWVRVLLDAAVGQPVEGRLIGADVSLRLLPPDRELAGTLLADLLRVWREGMAAPLPVAPRTALAWLAGRALHQLRAVYEGGGSATGIGGEGHEACLARLYPDLAALMADGHFEVLCERIYGPLARWVEASVTVVPHPVQLMKAGPDD